MSTPVARQAANNLRMAARHDVARRSDAKNQEENRRPNGQSLNNKLWHPKRSERLQERTSGAPWLIYPMGHNCLSQSGPNSHPGLATLGYATTAIHRMSIPLFWALTA